MDDDEDWRVSPSSKRSSDALLLRVVRGSVLTINIVKHDNDMHCRAVP